MTSDEATARQELQWAADMRVKHWDLWIKAASPLVVVVGVAVALHNNSDARRLQQELFQAGAEREWARKLFDAKLELYSRISAAAFKLKEARNQPEAVASLERLRDLQAEASLVIPSQMMFDIAAACEAAARYIESGKRDDRGHDGAIEPKDLAASCARLIAECRLRILHAESLALTQEDKAEDAVSTAYGAVQGGSEVIRRRHAAPNGPD